MTTPEIHAQLNHALELLEPLAASMRARDESDLFFSVAPDLARRVYDLIRQSIRELIDTGWLAGRRGRITHGLIAALGALQQARRTPTAEEALLHLRAASRGLTKASASLLSLAPQRSGR